MMSTGAFLVAMIRRMHYNAHQAWLAPCFSTKASFMEKFVASHLFEVPVEGHLTERERERDGKIK